MQQDWIKTLGKMTYGIYVLTSFHKEKVNGMIASWVSQISYDPLLIMAEVVDAQSFAEGTPFSSMDYNDVYLGKK